ncbi:hypothetical protein AB6E53_12890 [Vibrio breoganii]
MKFISKTHLNVILYNLSRRETDLVLERFSQLGCKLVVFNNSPSIEGYDYENKKNVVKYFGNERNVGIARAQTVCMEWSFSNGAEYVIQFDQDSEPNNDYLQRIHTSFEMIVAKEEPVGCLGATFYDKIDEVSEPEYGRIQEVDKTISSGLLIPKSTFLTVGAMADHLFIDYVDFEYCWRMKQSGLKTFVSDSVRLPHRIGEGKTKLIGISIRKSAPIRLYYQMRNLLILYRLDYVPIKWKKYCLKRLPIDFALNLILFDDRFSRLKYMLKGLAHGIVRKTKDES